ncbi:unnamed protein product [Oppiella nova]|uniref:Sulfotransferase domain-containing protein n=1 Tax=Oppiella nova TaxID=334625 RepID=A0A7R9MBJ5_9ACAR|nr:unnamed protein product [Oppiella nova]CAG2173257.1 unnamed protein product [Oppiella nova]
MALPVQKVRNHLFFSAHEPKNLEFALNYQPLDCDRILLAGPASGVHHCLHVLKNIMNRMDKIEHGQYVYFLDSHGFRVVDSQRGERDAWNPTLLATHTTLNLIAYNPRPKYLIIIRNPKDICVSIYRSWKSQTDLNIEFNAFFEMFITGRELPYGDYFEAMRVQWEHRDRGNCTLITYESLVDSPKNSILKMSEFLDLPNARAPVVMTALLYIIQTNDVKWDGMPGDWRAVLTQSQSDLIDEKVKDVWMGRVWSRFGNGRCNGRHIWMTNRF